MKQTEQRGMDHNGASTAEPQNEKFLISPPLLNLPRPGFPCPMRILKMSQHERYSWSLERTRRLLSHPKSSATFHQETLLIQTLPRGQTMRQLPWLCRFGQKTRHVATMLFHCPHSAAPVSFIVTESAGHTVLLPPPQPSSWFLLDPSISPNLSPETRHKAAGQNLAAFNLSGEIRRLRAFRLLCSAAINLKWSGGRWKLHPNGQLVHERENEPFHGPSGYNLPHSIRFDYPYLNT